jgi:hypothetical protein
MHRPQLLSERFVYLYKMALYAYRGEKTFDLWTFSTNGRVIRAADVEGVL